MSSRQAEALEGLKAAPHAGSEPPTIGASEVGLTPAAWTALDQVPCEDQTIAEN